MPPGTPGPPSSPGPHGTPRILDEPGAQGCESGEFGVACVPGVAGVPRVRTPGSPGTHGTYLGSKLTKPPTCYKCIKICYYPKNLSPNYGCNQKYPPQVLGNLRANSIRASLMPAMIGLSGFLLPRSPCHHVHHHHHHLPNIITFLSDPGIPGVRSMGPSVCNSLTE